MIVFYKKLAETPLEALERLRLEKPELHNETLSYAGRLDPAAEGELLMLVGDENKKREQFLGLDKEYEVEVLLGIATDTADIFGVPIRSEYVPDIPENIDEEVMKLIHIKSLPYPQFSSKTIEGVPMWKLTRDGKKFETEHREVKIYDVEIKEKRKITQEQIKEKVNFLLQNIKGDFRFNEIEENWNDVYLYTDYPSVTLRITCSAGAYMRSLAELLGEKLNVPAVAFSIKRTKIFL